MGDVPAHAAMSWSPHRVPVRMYDADDHLVVS
jgi:hypothetical protein